MPSRKWYQTLNKILEAGFIPLNLIPQGSGSLLDADTVDGEHASAFADAVHTHVEADITDLDHNAVKLQGRPLVATAPTAGQALVWNDGVGQWEPGSVTPGAHTHVEADITDLAHDAVKLQTVDVQLHPPLDAEVLTYVAANSRWEPAAVAAGGVHDAVKLQTVDVQLHAPLDGELLRYVAANSRWEPLALPSHTHVEADITNLAHDAVKLQGRDINAAVPADTNVLAWNSATSKWEPTAAGGGGGVHDAIKIQTVDVQLHAPLDTEVLTYVSANSRWEPKAAAGGGGGNSPNFLWQRDLVDPPTTGWSWLNQGSAIITDNGAGKGLWLETPRTAAFNVRARVRAAPATPYSIIFAAAMVMTQGAALFVGFRDSVGGRMVGIEMRQDTSDRAAIRKRRYSSPTSASADTAYGPFDTMANVPYWFKIEDDGTNYKAYLSANGINWVLLDAFTETETAFLAAKANEIVWGMRNAESIGGTNYTNLGTLLLSYEAI